MCNWCNNVCFTDMSQLCSNLLFCSCSRMIEYKISLEKKQKQEFFLSDVLPHLHNNIENTHKLVFTSPELNFLSPGTSYYQENCWVHVMFKGITSCQEYLHFYMSLLNTFVRNSVGLHKRADFQDYSWARFPSSAFFNRDFQVLLHLDCPFNTSWNIHNTRWNTFPLHT